MKVAHKSIPLDILDLDAHSLYIDGEDVVIPILSAAKHKFNAVNTQSVEMVINTEEDAPIIIICITHEEQDFDSLKIRETYKSYIVELTPDEWSKLSYNVLQMMVIKRCTK